MQEMKALSVRQPFASQIVIGEKTTEWRSKPFNWRGPLVICASKSAIRRNWTTGNASPVGGAGLSALWMWWMPPHDAEDLVAACCEDYEDEMYGFACELVALRSVVPVKGIAALGGLSRPRN